MSDISMLERMLMGAVGEALAVANAAQPGGGPLTIGGYTIFVDTDGSLKIKAPDATLVTLVVKT
jgi:hypothetical protein